MATKKLRKGPSASATDFSVGTIKKGNDGNNWIVVATKSNVHRWQKLTNNKSNKSKKIKLTKSKDNVSNNEDEDVWGKNKELEAFWRTLAKGETVVLIKKNNDYKRVKLNKNRAAEQLSEFDNDPNNVAILSSFMSQDAYELYLYPKAQDNSVEHVIKNYKKYFKAYGLNPKDPNKFQIFKKVMYPY